ncbi:MAG: hypothetical protein C0422_04745 [Alcaligenaceae bacterium]|nr:hypothetical protein [Alcaligenaceae bacterium]
MYIVGRWLNVQRNGACVVFYGESGTALLGIVDWQFNQQILLTIEVHRSGYGTCRFVFLSGKPNILPCSNGYGACCRGLKHAPLQLAQVVASGHNFLAGVATLAKTDTTDQVEINGLWNKHFNSGL